MFQFKAVIEIIGINPFVFVPEPILNGIFQQANKDKGPIPIKGTVNGKVYKQTLVKYRDAWRLYINTTMLASSPKRIGETIDLTVAFDPEERTLTPHPRLAQALQENIKAKAVFDNLRPSLQLEIVRYIANLKTEESIEKNVIKAIGFLLGANRFVGREKP